MRRDLVIRCAECDTPFVWMAEGQWDAAPPTRCPACRRLAPAPGRQRGIVKWYSRGRGYGFITPLQGADVFVHKSGLTGESAALRAGQLVEFSVSHTSRGAQAEQVEILELAETPHQTP